MAKTRKKLRRFLIQIRKKLQKLETTFQVKQKKIRKFVITRRTKLVTTFQVKRKKIRKFVITRRTKLKATFIQLKNELKTTLKTKVTKFKAKIKKIKNTYKELKNQISKPKQLIEAILKAILKYLNKLIIRIINNCKYVLDRLIVYNIIYMPFKYMCIIILEPPYIISCLTTLPIFYILNRITVFCKNIRRSIILIINNIRHLINITWRIVIYYWIIKTPLALIPTIIALIYCVTKKWLEWEYLPILLSLIFVQYFISSAAVIPSIITILLFAIRRLSRWQYQVLTILLFLTYLQFTFSPLAVIPSILLVTFLAARKMIKWQYLADLLFLTYLQNFRSSLTVISSILLAVFLLITELIRWQYFAILSFLIYQKFIVLGILYILMYLKLVTWISWELGLKYLQYLQEKMPIMIPILIKDLSTNLMQWTKNVIQWIIQRIEDHELIQWAKRPILLIFQWIKNVIQWIIQQITLSIVQWLEEQGLYHWTKKLVLLIIQLTKEWIIPCTKSFIKWMKEEWIIPCIKSFIKWMKKWIIPRIQEWIKNWKKYHLMIDDVIEHEYEYHIGNRGSLFILINLSSNILKNSHRYLRHLKYIIYCIVFIGAVSLL